MKNKLIILGLTLLLVLGCTNYEQEVITPQIDLGIKSTSTAIKSVILTQHTVTMEFSTTPGAKYSVQMVPFGAEQPYNKDKFTATSATTTRVYNLTEFPKNSYDFIFMDIDGKEVKFPIVVK
jgi:hypothetical protein